MAEQSGEKKQVMVSILGQTFPLVTTGDPADTELLALEVDDLMTNIAKHSKNLDSTRVAILASLHLADRLRQAEADLKRAEGGLKKAESELKSMSTTLETRARRLSDMLAELA